MDIEKALSGKLIAHELGHCAAMVLMASAIDRPPGTIWIEPGDGLTADARANCDLYRSGIFSASAGYFIAAAGPIADVAYMDAIQGKEAPMTTSFVEMVVGAKAGFSSGDFESVIRLPLPDHPGFDEFARLIQTAGRKSAASFAKMAEMRAVLGEGNRLIVSEEGIIDWLRCGDITYTAEAMPKAA